MLADNSKWLGLKGRNNSDLLILLLNLYYLKAAGLFKYAWPFRGHQALPLSPGWAQVNFT